MTPEAPEGWVASTLGAVIDGFEAGRNLRSQGHPAKPGDLGVLKISAVTWGRFRPEENKALLPGDEPKAHERIRQGDLLITRANTSDLVGAVVLVERDHPNLMLPDKILRINPIAEVVERRFLVHALRSKEVRDHFEHNATGTSDSMRNLSQPKMAAAPLAIPPLAEQRRIVAKVEALFAEVNSARDRLAKVPPILKRFRQSVLAAACSGKLTEEWRQRTQVEAIEATLKRVHVAPSKTGREATEEITPGVCILSVGNPSTPTPNGWAWLPLTDIAKLESGHTPSRKHPEYWDGTIPWIGILDAGSHHGSVIMKTLQTVTQAGLDNSAARLLPARTVCLSRTASVGYVVIMGRSMATSQDFVNWVCSEALVPEFLMYALMAEGEDIKRFGRGSTHTTIYYPEVKALHICLPPVEEQREIVRRVEALLPAADTILSATEHALERTRRVSQAILAKAFSGELVPTEAELARGEGRDYEPASVLLERIQAERAAQANGASTPRRPRNGTNSKTETASAEVAREGEPVEAQTNGNAHAVTPRKPIEQFDTDEVMAAFRQACWGLGDDRIDRDELLRRTAQKLGYQKLGQNIREALRGHLRAAIRRKIVGVDGQLVYSMTPTAGSLDTDALLETLSSVTQKNREHQRDEVIRAAAKHLGFSQVTDAFREQMKSAFNAAVRRGVLERQGAEIVVRVK